MTPQPQVPTHDVTVIGAGPTGAMASLRCAQRGLSVVCIDTSTEVYPLPRAIGLDAEGQRLFETAGLGHALRACSTPMRGAEFLNHAGRRVVGFDLPPGFVTPLGHPPIVAFEQPELERALREAVIAAGVDLRLGVEATGLDDRGDRIMVNTTAGDLDSAWVVGADGASSWVRRQVGVTLEDQGFDQPWLVVDATNLDPSLIFSRLAQQHCSPDRVVTMVPGHATRRRWEFQLRPGETRDQMLDPATIAHLLAPWGTPEQLRVDRAAVYRFHGLVASRFRNGRVLLAGDAAHQMPPFQGQGMCSGLRDADNLAWKLALVQRGLADMGLVDTYDAERRPHAIAVVEHSCDTGRLIDAIAAGKQPDTEAGYGGGRGFPHLVDGFLTGDHPAVGKPMPQPLVEGRRLDELLADGFALVSVSSFDLAPEWARLGARAVVLPEESLPESLLASDSVVIVRPDRYVAAVTDDASGAFERLFATGRH